MSSFILISSSVTLSLIIAHLIIKKLNLLKPSQKDKNNVPIFLSNEEALKFITQKAKLSDEEKDLLSILFSIVSGNRLHQGFEDKEIATRWLITTRRAIVNSDQFDLQTKEDLEYTAYEIFRKINNARMLNHPSVKHISDLNIGQPVTVQFSDKMTVAGSLVDSNFYSLTVSISEQDSLTIKGLKLEKKQVQVSFWKIMDAQYSFKSSVNAAEKKNKSITLILSNPKQIECVQIRSYPRQDVEIPIKFRQAVISTDPDTGALQESFNNILFGIINNIGPWGCSIISHIPIPVHTVLMIEIPLFSQILYIKGTIRNLSRRGEIFIFNIEFAEDTLKTNTLSIYHYIFAEDSSQ